MSIVGDWLTKLWSIHEIEYFAAIKQNGDSPSAWPSEPTGQWTTDLHRVPHVWFLQHRHCEESGSTAPAGSWTWLGEGFSGSWRFETVLSAECSGTLLTGVSSSTNPFRPQKVCSFLQQKECLQAFLKPLFINWWIFKGKLNLNPVHKSLAVTQAILYRLLLLLVLNIDLAEYSWISVSQEIILYTLVAAYNKILSIKTFF